MPSLSEMMMQGQWAPELEDQFQRDMILAPGWRDWRRGFIAREGVEPSIAPGGDYNYRLAWLSGATPEMDPGSGEVHGFSSADFPPFKDPIPLKAEDHPTAWKEGFLKKFNANPDVAAREGQLTPEMARYLVNAVMPKFGDMKWGNK